MLSDKDLLALQDKLKSIKSELEALVISIGKNTKTVELDSSIGRLTRIDALSQQSMEKAKHSNIDLRLKAIDAALMRIDNKEYGQCLECGEQISLARLHNSPEIVFCIPCQSERE